MPYVDVDALRVRAAEVLDGSDAFARPWMRPVFEKVERHRFVPDTVWLETAAGFEPLRGADDPGRWAELAYDPDRAVVTQVDDGEPGGPVGSEPTSSISAPRAVFTTLAELDPHPGDRILEIGTGTGYHAALLAERVGAGRVTSVEIDRGVCERARAALESTGHPVTVVCGDGESGCPARAPFDRVLATAAVLTVPYP